MAALTAALLVADVLLGVTMPSAVPRDTYSRSQLVLVVPIIASSVVAFVLAYRKPKNQVGWLLGVFVLFLPLGSTGSNYLDHGLYGLDVPRALIVPLGLTAVFVGGVFAHVLIQLALTFPDGHLLSRRWRVVAWVNAAVGGSWVASLFDPSAVGDSHRQLPNPLGLTGAQDVVTTIGVVQFFIVGVLLILTLASLVIRFRRADHDVRQQVKWFGAGVVVTGVGVSLGSGTSQGSFPTSPLGLTWLAIGFSALPVAIGIAVLKYRLYDIDVVISRALVYGVLALFITAIYVGIVVGVGTLIGSSGKPNLALSILATAVVAVGFQPVRERLQKVANRLVYGARATPYEVLSQFSTRVSESYAGQEVLPRMARVLADGTGAEHATVWLRSAQQLRPAATHPDDVAGYEPLTIRDGQLPEFPQAPRAVAVRHQGELLGALTVTKRRGESLTPIEEKLLDDLAHQAGLVLKNVGLSADLEARLDELRASRQRLVAAQDHERRRLERNLHDGAQQHLVALKIKLGLAETLLLKDPESATALIGDLKGDADEALETLRDLARGIYPPLLADRGLAAALEAQARKATVPVAVEGEGLGRFSQEVESAVYFCCLEALQNVQKYAGAGAATVSLAKAGGHLRFSVSDDGGGFDAETATRGAGLQNMADRLDALGGEIAIESSIGRGTTVSGTIPVGEASAGDPGDRPAEHPAVGSLEPARR